MEGMPRQHCETELTLIYCRAIWVRGSEHPCEQQQLRLLWIDALVNGGVVGFATEGPQNLSSSHSMGARPPPFPPHLKFSDRKMFCSVSTVKLMLILDHVGGVRLLTLT